MKLNRNSLFERLQDLQNELEKLNNILFALKTTDIQKYGENYRNLSTDAALRSERITCQLRNLVYAADVTRKAEYMKQAADVHGIQISMEDGILSVKLPGLLPKRRIRNNTAFLYEPLNYAMQEYLKEHCISLYQDCVVCFSHVYDKTLSLCRIRDYDNLEFKQILDTISTYVLLDDTGLFCDSYHTTELGQQDCTIICIMEKERFAEWFQKRKNHIKTISEIS